jgi:hypothetical protein
MTADPPLLVGMAKDTDDDALAYEVAAGAAGAPGTTIGVTALEGADGIPVPAALVAPTRNS